MALADVWNSKLAGEGHRIAWHLRVLDRLILGSSLADSDLVFKLYFRLVGNLRQRVNCYIYSPLTPPNVSSRYRTSSMTAEIFNVKSAEESGAGLGCVDFFGG